MAAGGDAAGKAGAHIIGKALEQGGVRAAAKVGAKAGAESAEKAAAKSAAKAAEKIGGHSVDDLMKAARELDRNGLTRAGRAAQKHGDRPGSVFPRTSGGAAARNEAGEAVVRDILHDPNGRREVLDNVINIWDSTGRGVRFSRDGRFMGFLEPVT